MEELPCKGTPAQVVDQIITVLLRHPDLLVCTDGNYDDDDDKGNDFRTWLEEYGRERPRFDSVAYRASIVVYSARHAPEGAVNELGRIVAEGMPYGTLLRAGRSLRTRSATAEGTVRISYADFDPSKLPLAPFWEEVKAELQRLELTLEPSAKEERRAALDTTKNTAQTWLQIPEQGWNRKAVEFWCKGYSGPEIADSLQVAPKTVNNRISDLRNIYGEGVVPFHRKRKSG